MNVEYFFKKSFVSEFFSIHEAKIKRKKNLIIDHDDTDYIRVMKLFNDSTGETKVDFFKSDIDPSIISIIEEEFYLRCWLPKNIIRTKGKKIEKVIILFNGLNETEHFHLYDMLGSFFSERGYGVILLPTPLHLNRSNQTSEMKYPIDYALNNDKHSILFYYNFLKSKKELDYLIKKSILSDKK